MKSQELVHIHALLFELRAYLERNGIAPADAFDTYEAQPVRPTHIHRPKTAHEDAIALLLDGFAEAVRTRPQLDYASVS